MKNKKIMTKKDRKDYFKYVFKTHLIDNIILFIGRCIEIFLPYTLFVVFVFQPEKITNKLIIGYIATVIIVHILIFLFSTSFKVLFKKELYIIDGHIFKKHLAKKDHESRPIIPMARAISEDGGISTKWIAYPKRYFKRGKQKVKIIVYKNKAIDFYF